MSKPRIGVDLDGCICDLVDYTLACVNDELGTYYRYEDWTAYRAKDCFSPDVAKIFQKIVYHPDTYKVLKPIDGALPALEKLAKKADIIIVTSRPVDCAPATHEWLASYEVPSIGLIMTKDKAGYAEALGMQAFVDDKYETAVSIMETACLSLLMDQPWNQREHIPGMWRVYDWDDVIYWVERVIDGVPS